MVGNWTLGRRIGAGFALVVLFAVVEGIVAIVALRNVVAEKDHVISVDAQLLIDAARLQGQLERNGGANRGFLLTGDERFLETEKQAHIEFGATLDALKKNAVTEEGRRLLDAIGRGELEHEAAAEKVMAQRRAGVGAEKLYALFKSDVYPLREALDSQITSFVDREKNILESGRKESSAEASSAINIVTAIALVAAIAAALLAALLTRSLTRQIGASVAQAQTSSAELQAASNQQATGAREQATALNEITTTIRELLATSRQITESAGQVARIAEETARSARAGDGTVHRAHDSVSAIRKQVDVIVAHMLELGKKSHQIGSVLEIVSELAEQTNILAINATIEAAGAGEAGRRFSIVADEIRKLSDRVASSAKEIRTLIEDVRGSVNTTVMATESGSKAVDAGSREFDEVASAFTRISDLVATTTQAAREIQLSTKQQSTAVEQVDIAIANVAQAAKEAEASSGQVLETASLVAGISRGLARLVHTGMGQT